MSRTNGSRREVPANIEAEAILLGSAILRPDARPELDRLQPSDFWRPAHQHIAAAVLDMHHAGQAIDYVTVAEELTQRGVIEEIGGWAEVTNLPLGANSPEYANLILGAARRRQLITVGNDLAAAGYDGTDAGPILPRLTELLVANEPCPLMLEDVGAALDGHRVDEPSVLVRSDGARLLYAGAVNALIGEPSAGKTTMAGMAVVQVLAQGGAVVYLDYEDVIDRLARRMIAVGADRASLVANFRYGRLPALTEASSAALARAVQVLNADLVVIDGVADSMALQGLDEDVAGDVGAWWVLLPRPLADTGAAVLILDHVAKAKEGRGRWARGSGAKLAAIDGAAYLVEAVEPFSRTRAGRLRVTIAKDRPGHVGATGDTAATVHLTPVDGRIGWTIDAPLPDPETASDAADGRYVPSDFVDNVFTAVAEALGADGPPGPTRSVIVDHLTAAGLKFDTKLVTPALIRLAKDGRITRTPRKGGGHHHSLPAVQEHLPEVTS